MKGNNKVYTYRSKAKWNNSVLFQIIFSALIWLPLAWLGFTYAIKISDLKTTLLFSSLLAIWALLLFHRAHNKIKFPALEVSSEHLVLNKPMQNRTVYNLTQVRGAKLFGNTLYFRHLGWPVITPLGSMPKEEQLELLKLLSTHEHM